jgi:hypothetical protein
MVLRVVRSLFNDGDDAEIEEREFPIRIPIEFGNGSASTDPTAITDRPAAFASVVHYRGLDAELILEVLPYRAPTP